MKYSQINYGIIFDLDLQKCFYIVFVISVYRRFRLNSNHPEDPKKDIIRRVKG
jgi:hypothetical protein